MLFPSIGTAEEIVRSCPPGTFAGEAVQASTRDPWRSALSSAFTGLWFDAQVAGLVETRDLRAFPGPAYFGEVDDNSIRRTLRAVRVGRLRIDDVLEQSVHGAGLVYLVVRSLWGRCSRVSVQEVVDATPWPWFVDRSEGEMSRAADSVREAVEAMVEAGVLEGDGDRAWLTPFGAWTVDNWLCRQFDPEGW